MASSEQISAGTTEVMINEFLEAMKKKDGDSEEGLQKAFRVLAKGPNPDNALVSADLLRRAIKNRGPNLTVGEVEATILYIMNKEKVEGEYQINCKQFIQIVKSLEEPTVADQVTKTCRILGRKNGEKIVLYGQPGVGKTWMARKIARRALRQGKFDVAIWVYLNRTYEGLSLQESIAYQLSLLAAFKEYEAKEEARKKEDKAEEEEAVKNVKRKRDKIERMIREAMEKKKVLLVLDDEGSKTNLGWSKVDGKDGEQRLSLNSVDLSEMLGLNKVESCEFLITSKNQPNDGIGIMVRPLTEPESEALVTRGDKSKEMHDLAEFFIGKSERLPSEILIIARVMSYFTKEKLCKDKEALENDKDLKVGDVLIRGYKRLPKNVLIDGYSLTTPERHFLPRGGMVNFNELISYWIMEGHLGHFDRIEDAYEEGHRVLMELIHCGLLEKQEGNNVAPSGPRFDFDILDRDEFFRRVHSGLGETFNMKLGSIALDDGMIRTVSNNPKVQTFLLDGNHIGENELFLSTSELENLAIFNPTCQHFQLPILKMHNLRLLVLRGCRFLTSIDRNFQWTKDLGNHKVTQRSQSLPSPHTSNQNPSPPPPTKPDKKLDKLTVLEICGPSSLSEIPDNLFTNTPNLKTLNMSYLDIEFLPSSFYQLTKIEYLILRGCSRLRELRSLKNLKDLQVLDVSGSTSLEKFHDKSLRENTKLQILNLSQTKIKTLPLINSNQALKFVLLSNCKELQRIRKIDNLGQLQIFDISGSIEVEEFCDPSLESLTSIKILDVSCTSMRRLPSNVSNPRFLYARNCPRLKRLPPIENFTKVETIDLSSSCLLEDIRTEFFSNMKCLRELNLSKTRIKHLPSLATLRRLSLSECEQFEEMDNLSYLQELEFLDLSGCKCLKEMEDNCFEKMVRLGYLNLSGTHLARVPSMSKLISLKELYVRDCPNLTALSGIEEIPMLEILDHSGTILKPAPFTNSNRCPRVLGASVDNIDHQQLLKTLGVSGVSSDESESNEHVEDLRPCKWRISNWQHETANDAVYGIHFLHLMNKYPSLMTKDLSGFKFLVYPTEAEGELPDKCSYRSEVRLREIYFKQVSLQEIEKCLEVRGFDRYPPFVGRVLEQARFVFLVDDLFLKSLVDLGVDSGVMGMKVCWIEKCDELEYVVGCKKEEDGKKQDKKKKVDGNKHDEKKQGKDANKQEKKEEDEKKKDDAKKQEENKKREDANKQEEKKKEDDTRKQEEKKEEDKANEQEEKKKQEDDAHKQEEKKEDDAHKQEKEKKEEDASKQEGKKKEEEDANKQEEKKKEEGEANKQEENKKAEDDAHKQEEKKKEEDYANKQEEKKEDNVGKQEDDAHKQKEIKKEEDDIDKQEEKKKEEDGTKKQEQKKKGEDEANKQEETKKVAEDDAHKQEEEKNPAEIFKNLEILWISDNMNLKSILKGDIQSISFKSITSLYLEYCPLITTICSSSSQLENLETLYVKYCRKMDTLFTDDSPQLKKLTKLHLWGLQELKGITFKAPYLRSLKVGECPLLEHVIDTSSKANEQQEVEGHDNLKTLHIKYCDKVKSICKEDMPYFPKLRKLEMLALPEVQEVAFSTPLLQYLRVGECRKLRQIEGSTSNSNRLDLLEVKHCEELKTVFGRGGLDVGNVEKIELLSLPEVDNVGGANFLPSTRENRIVWGCPKLCGTSLDS